jgi:hypothetical protein
MSRLPGPEWRAKDGGPDGDNLPAPERELLRQLEAQAEQIRRLEAACVDWMRMYDEWGDTIAEITAILDKTGKVNAPEQTTADRVRALVRYVGEVEKEGSNYADLCQEAHIALNDAGAPIVGTPADRIRALASRAEPLTTRDQAIAAELLADLGECADAGEPPSIYTVNALRLVLRVEA